MTGAAAGERPIRVLFYVRYYPPDFGGHGLLVQRTLPLLRPLGVEVDVLSTRLAGGEEVDPGVTRTIPRGESPWLSLRRFVALRRHLRRYATRYDLYHTVVPLWDSVLNIDFARGLGLPVVFEMNLMGGNDPVSLLRTRWGGKRVELLKRADAWVGVSRGFLPAVREVGFPEERFHVVYGAVDTERFSPPEDEAHRSRLRERLGLPADARIAISVGSVIPRKGMDRLLRAWRGIDPRPGRDLLLIVGPDRAEDRLTPDEVRHAASIRAEAEADGLAGTVRMQGRVDNVEEYLRAADLFVFLSRKEGLGLVVIEAMSSGLPCLVTPLDGIAAEMVLEGETGHIVDSPDDSAAVAGPLAELLRDPVAGRRLGEAGRRVALEKFSMQARAESAARFYRRMVRGR